MYFISAVQRSEVINDNKSWLTEIDSSFTLNNCLIFLIRNQSIISVLCYPRDKAKLLFCFGTQLSVK